MPQVFLKSVCRIFTLNGALTWQGYGHGCSNCYFLLLAKNKKDHNDSYDVPNLGCSKECPKKACSLYSSYNIMNYANHQLIQKQIQSTKNVLERSYTFVDINKYVVGALLSQPSENKEFVTFASLSL